MNRTSVVFLLLLLASCASGPRHTVADAELAVLGGKGLDRVEAARQEAAAARQAVAARRIEEQVALREIRIAEYSIRRDEADLEVARLKFEAAQETHDAETMLPANGRRAQAEHAVTASRAELAFRVAAHDYQVARVDEALAAERVALATLERAKLDAVLGGQDPLLPAQAERKAAFDVQLAKARAAHSEESERVVRMKGTMQSSETEWKALLGAKP